MNGAVVMLFLVLVPMTGVALWYRKTQDDKDQAYAGQNSSPRRTNTHAPRPQPRTVRTVQPQRPVAVAPEPAPRRRLSRRTYQIRQHRKLQRIRAAYSLEIELLRAEIARLEAALLEKLILENSNDSNA